jgi:hypothetical protein
MKAATNTTTGYRIERLLSQGELPLRKVVKLYGVVSVGLAGKDVIITGYYSNSQGYVLTVDTASRSAMTVQAYGKTGIAVYDDQADADQDFSARQAEYKAAFAAGDWATCKTLIELNG